MKKDKLIEELKKIPENIDVCLYDYRQSLHYANSDEQCPNNSVGVHDEFRVERISENTNKPFIGLVIKNEDYDDVGNKMAK